MADKLTWFKFQVMDWTSGRIQKRSKEAQADFVWLCCKYWNEGCEMTLEDATLETCEESIQELIKYKIVKLTGDKISISFLDDQYKDAIKTTKKASEAGKASAESRRNKAATTDEHPLNGRSTTVQRPFNDRSTDVEQNRIEENRIDKNINNVVEMENSQKPKEVFTEENAFDKIHMGKAQVYEPTGTNIADYVQAYEAWRDRSLVDSLFQSTYTIKFNTTAPEIKRLLNDFHHHLIATDKFHHNLSSWKRHFVSWMEIKRNAGEIKQPMKIYRSNGE